MFAVDSTFTCGVCISGMYEVIFFDGVSRLVQPMNIQPMPLGMETTVSTESVPGEGKCWEFDRWSGLEQRQPVGGGKIQGVSEGEGSSRRWNQVNTKEKVFRGASSVVWETRDSSPKRFGNH